MTALTRGLRVAAALVVAGASTACGGEEAPPRREGAPAVERAPGAGAEADPVQHEGPGTPETELDGVRAEPQDWRILAEKIRWARQRGLDTLPVGETVARMGLSFVGTPYVPHTLEAPGPERTVVDFRGLDCVTFVETVLATVRVLKDPEMAGVDDEKRLADGYVRALERLRYRGGIRNGYASRLHYFSEWIRDGEEKGLLRDVTAELGGIEDPEPVSFMSTHPGAYERLSDPATLERIRSVESSLSRRPRIYVPEDALPEASQGILSGDVIAATSTVEGLDVAHTGIALWRDGTLHLLHAPLVGDSVQVSPRPLAERIRQIESQDGVLVARPNAIERRF